MKVSTEISGNSYKDEFKFPCLVELIAFPGTVFLIYKNFATRRYNAFCVKTTTDVYKEKEFAEWDSLEFLLALPPGSKVIMENE
jgi:hypothetical protein